MAYNYVVTANRASGVIQSLTGNFTSSKDLNLIIAKLSRIEISTVTPDGLKPIKEFGVYGRISALKLFRPPGSSKDLLFMLTRKYHVAILECVEGSQPGTFEIITRRSGYIADPASQVAENGDIVVIDPECKMIGLRLYNGLFKIIPLDKNKLSELESFNIRLEENIVPDITFLHGFANPTIGLIYKDHTSTCHIKTYEISIKEKEFLLGPWGRDFVANEACMIIAVPEPFGGVIIVAHESIAYINGNIEKSIAPPIIKQAPIHCYEHIDKDGRRYLLGDTSGRLFCLILEPSDYRLSDRLEVKDIRLEMLGEVAIPESITYLDNAIVYIGSKLGDSQLIKLLTIPDENGSYVQILETYTNLGPISDMCLVDLEKQGQGQLVTCSGYSKDGSLRVIRNGIGINEKLSFPYKDIKGVWGLKIGKAQTRHNYLVVTFVQESFLWQCHDDGSFEDIKFLGGFDRERTILCANLSNEQIVQVTRKEVRLINAITRDLIETWALPSGNKIFQAFCRDNDVICADGDKLYVIRIEDNNLQAEEKILPAQIGCFHINSAKGGRDFLSVGFWWEGTKELVINIIIYSYPGIVELHREPLNTFIPPGSIMTANFEDQYYLFCALRNGPVFYYNFDAESGVLSNGKKVILGTGETILRPFKSHSTTSIFACSNRPTVIYSSNNKLVFSNVNLDEVNCVCSLDTMNHPDSLVLASDSELIIGTIDEIQKLHIKTIPLQETPIKIAHQNSTQTFGLLTIRTDIHDSTGPVISKSKSASVKETGKSMAATMTTVASKPTCVVSSDLMEIETYNLLILDQHTFEVLHSHQFMTNEAAISILSTRLGDGQEEYFVVGTAFVHQDEPEPKTGRLVVYRWIKETTQLQQIAELSIKGCPYSLCEFDGKFLAGVNASVNLIELNSRRDLHIECTHVNVTMTLYLKRKGHMILVGDLMRSMSVISYKPLQAHFEEVARDLNPAWMLEVEILDDDLYLGAEHEFNLFVCKRDSKATNDQDRQQMQHVGMFHLGDSVNVFQQGSLIVQHPSESTIDVKRTTLFGTVDGVIGLIISLDEELFKRLQRIQNSICNNIKSIGGIDHKEWRAFVGNKTSYPAVGFLDGDLIETFLDLGREKMNKVAKESGESVDDLVKIMEELSRLH